MIILPNSVVLVGEGVESMAVSALFGLFVSQIKHCNPDNFEKEAQEILPHEKDGLVVAVSTCQHSLSAAFFINFLVFIRLHHQWKGKILLIADPYDSQRVEKWDLFQLQRGSKYVAQKCLKRPLMLGDLLAAMSALRPYLLGAWRLMMNTLQGKDCITNAQDLIDKIEKRSMEEQWDIEILRELYNMLLDENLVLKDLIGHDAVNGVRKHSSALNLDHSAMKRYLGTHGTEIVTVLQNIKVRLPQSQYQFP